METTTAEVNLRTGSSTNNSIILTMPEGAEVLLYGYEKYSNGDIWYKAKYKEHIGYVKSDYVLFDYHEYENAITGYASANVNMRTGIFTSTSVIKQIPKGAEVKIYGYYKMNGADWYKVSYDGDTGICNIIVHRAEQMIKRL